MIAKSLESNGAIVYIVGRWLEVLEKAALEHSVSSLASHYQISSSSHLETPDVRHQKRGNIIPIRGDITSKESLQEVVATIKEKTGYINLLVNNSGILGQVHRDKPEKPSIEELQKYLWEKETAEEFTNVFNVNVTGVWFTTVAFLGLLAEGNKEGRGIAGVSSQVVTISSIAGFRRYCTTIGFIIF